MLFRIEGGLQSRSARNLHYPRPAVAKLKSWSAVFSPSLHPSLQILRPDISAFCLQRNSDLGNYQLGSGVERRRPSLSRGSKSSRGRHRNWFMNDSARRGPSPFERPRAWWSKAPFDRLPIASHWNSAIALARAPAARRSRRPGSSRSRRAAAANAAGSSTGTVRPVSSWRLTQGTPLCGIAVLITGQPLAMASTCTSP